MLSHHVTLTRTSAFLKCMRDCKGEHLWYVYVFEWTTTPVLARVYFIREFLWQDDILWVVHFVAECLDFHQAAFCAFHEP